LSFSVKDLAVSKLSTDQSHQPSHVTTDKIARRPISAGEITVKGLKKDIRHSMVLEAHAHSEGKLVSDAAVQQ